MLSCKKASELVEKKSMGSLSFVENIQLSMHSSVCGACKQYQKQSALIDEALEKYLRLEDATLFQPVADVEGFKQGVIEKLSI